MKIKQANAPILGVILLSLITTATEADSSKFNPLRHPKLLPQRPNDTALSCAQLDREISRTVPYTYNYRTDYGDDPYAGASIIAGATISLIGYGYLAFSAVNGIVEDNRIQSASSRIDGLRRLKAEKHCYEDRG